MKKSQVKKSKKRRFPTPNRVKKMLGIYESDDKPFKDVEIDGEDFKYYLQIWQHQDSMFWSRFNAFITFLTIGIAFLSVLIVIYLTSKNTDFNQQLIMGTMAFVSFVMLVIGVLWQGILSRTHIYVRTYLDLAFEAQKNINRDNKEHLILIPEEKRQAIEFYQLAAVKSIVAVNIIFWCGHGLFLAIWIIGSYISGNPFILLFDCAVILFVIVLYFLNRSFDF